MITDDAMGFAFATFDVYNNTACVTEDIGYEVSKAFL